MGAGNRCFGQLDDRLDDYGDEYSSGPFDIVRTKNASVKRLKRWRQAALVLNASRRFRYTLDLKKEEEKKQRIGEIRAHAQVIRMAHLFLAAAEQNGTPQLPPTPVGDYGIGQEALASLTRDQDFSTLQEYGGVKGMGDMLKTNLVKGIHGDDDLVNLRNAFGSNTYPRKKGRSFWRFLWEACRDTTLIILMVAAAASLGLGIKSKGIKEGWYDGGSISLAVIIVIIATATSDYKQSLQFQNLNEEKQNIHLEVIRGGRRVEVSIFDIVVGDVVPLKIGDQVPADGIFISGHSLAIDESSMTGESKIVLKGLKAPFLMSGCKVADGYGTMLVTGVGIKTEWGLLMASISEDTGEETPLQVRLNGVATFIGIVGLVVASAVLIVLLVRYFTGHTFNPDGSRQFIAGKTSFGTAIDGVIKFFTVAVTIVVVAVPEGLPLAVTLTLAYSMRKMMADKALVRRLSACETMGSATTICSGKTGTLTLNQMTVVEAYACGKKIDPPDDRSMLHPKVTSLLIEGIAHNTTGSVFMPEGGGDLEVSGSPTEKAILRWAINLGMNFDSVRSDSSIIHVLPFNSEKKRGGVALKLPDSAVRIHWKGAAEIVLASCKSYVDENNDVVPLKGDQVTLFENAIEDMASRSLRCVTIAYRRYEMGKVPTNEEELACWEIPENELVLLAIVGLKDPCRPGVKEAVQLCTKAGIKVCMVTGDNLQTAKALAIECGILSSDAEATVPTLIEGRTFRAMSEVERQEIAEKISVMGRSAPNDKLLLVQALRKRSHVVAVTGDCSNDAPALRAADIGLSMGIKGTKVTKESSDIIILDDNFASVVKVVRWGRSVYANIQKFIQFQLTVNVAALVINVVAVVSAGNVPLNAVQLLWVNLIMDTLGALALATEPPTDQLMQRPPVGRRERPVTNIMWRNLLTKLFIQFQVSVNVAALVICVVAVVSGGNAPLKALQILWVNLIMNTLSALALITEPPTDHLTHSSPVGRREPLVTNIMWRNLFTQALYQVTVLLILNFKGRSILNIKHENLAHANRVKNTLIFNAFVFCQIFNEFNAREPNDFNVFEGVTRNRLFMGTVGLTIMLQVIIIFFLGKFFSIVRLSWKLWLVSIAIGFFSWPLAMIGKLIPAPETPLSEIMRKLWWRRTS